MSPSPHAPEGPSGALTSGGQREESHIVEAVSLSEATGTGSGGVEEMKNKAAFSPEGAIPVQSGPGLSLHPAPDAVETTASPTPVSLAGVTTPDTARGVTVEVEPLPPVPSTSLQFVADWKELRGQEGRMLAYFQVCVCACCVCVCVYVCGVCVCVCMCMRVQVCMCVCCIGVYTYVQGLCTLVSVCSYPCNSCCHGHSLLCFSPSVHIIPLHSPSLPHRGSNFL